MRGSAAQRQPIALLATAAVIGLSVLALHTDALHFAWLLPRADPWILSCLLLLAVALYSESRQQRIGALAGAAGAAAIAGGMIASLLAAPDPAAAVAYLPAASGLALAFGIALRHCGSRRPRSRFVALVGASLVSLGLSTTVLLAAALGLPIAAGGQPLGSAFAMGGAAAAALDFVLRGPGRLRTRHALSVLSVPVIAASVVVTATVCWLVWELDDLDAAERFRWTALTIAASICLTSAALGAARTAAREVMLRDLNVKRRSLLARQRAVIRERTTALRQARLQYDQLFLSVPAAVLLTDLHGDVVAVNPAMIRLLACETEAAIRKRNFADFYAYPADRSRVLADWYASGRDHREDEVTLRRSDGKLVHVLYSGQLIKDPQGRVQYQQGIFTDITALRHAEARRRALEADLRLAKKLESVGRLATGVAHEINTPMQYIGDNVYFLRGAFEGLAAYVGAARTSIAAVLENRSPEALRDVQAVEQEIEIDDLLRNAPRALARTDEGVVAVTRIVAAMKELAHPDRGTTTRADINALIDTALVISRHEYETIAEVETSLGAVPPMPVYKNELCQALINLIINASHAIESAKHRDSRAGLIRIATSADHARVRIAIADNGCGIPETVRDRVFDPFFTTKDVGKGTGQGLAIARAAVVEKHRGELNVESTVGIGTTFTIELPLEGTGYAGSSTAKEIES